jgi:hypothetical protein
LGRLKQLCHDDALCERRKAEDNMSQRVPPAYS